MRNVKLCLLFLTMLCSAANSSVNAQSNTVGVSLRLGLLNFCDVFSPTIQPGVQLDIKNRFAVGVDCGIGILSLLEEDSSNNKYGNHHYYKLKAEGKYFFKQKEKQNLAKRIFPYISIEHMYFHHTYSPKNQYVEVKKSKK